MALFQTVTNCDCGARRSLVHRVFEDFAICLACNTVHVSIRNRFGKRVTDVIDLEVYLAEVVCGEQSPGWAGEA